MNEGERLICRSIPIQCELSVGYNGNMKRGALHLGWGERWDKRILVVIRGDRGCPKE